MIAGIIAVAATYFYFLLFAQFAFLEIVKSKLTFEILTPIMAAMGISGILSSFLTGRLIDKDSNWNLVPIGFIICGVGSILSIFVDSLSLMLTNAMIIGIGLGILTVSLASGLVTHFSPKKLGLGVGIGTGSAYFLCNVPSIFTATPISQCLSCHWGMRLWRYFLK